jgi:hypothetical protein
MGIHIVSVATDKPYFQKENPTPMILIKDSLKLKFIKMLKILIDKIIVMFGGPVFQQSTFL